MNYNVKYQTKNSPRRRIIRHRILLGEESSGKELSDED
jgi:hypothetical protein